MTPPSQTANRITGNWLSVFEADIRGEISIRHRKHLVIVVTTAISAACAAAVAECYPTDVPATKNGAGGKRSPGGCLVDRSLPRGGKPKAAPRGRIVPIRKKVFNYSPAPLRTFSR